jgi:hypothetical protein
VKVNRPKYRAETFKMVFVAAAFFIFILCCRSGGYTKIEGIVLAAFFSLVWFFIGRISVPPSGDDDDIE